MTDIMASIGLVQLERYNDLLNRRNEIVEKYNSGFNGTIVKPLVHVPTDNSYKSSMHLYIVHLDGLSRGQCDIVIQKMAEVGIACNVHYKPLPMLTAYRNMGFDIKDFPNALTYFDNTMTLPLHTKLTNEEVDYIINNLKTILESI